MEISFSDEKAYLLFHCKGTFDYGGLSALVERIGNEAKAPGTRVVVDFRSMDGDFDNLTRYRTGELVAEKLKDHRILSLARREAINRLAENTAVNRGASVLTTSDEEQGMAWLLERNS